MNIVIDAQVVSWYLAESLGATTPATESPDALFERLGGEDTAFVDEGGQIQHEWRSVTDADWFDQWFGELLVSGAIVIVEAQACRALLTHLHGNLGFPRSRDVWYIRTAAGVGHAIGLPVGLVTEDMDFYDPPSKVCTPGRRARILAGCSGSVARHLRREGILVRSLIAHCSA